MGIYANPYIDDFPGTCLDDCLNIYLDIYKDVHIDISIETYVPCVLRTQGYMHRCACARAHVHGNK